MKKTSKPVSGQPTISAYNSAQTGEWKKICELLRKEIDATLKGAESKVWHRNPVWFIDGNPVAGYGKLKDCVQLLFWSGQSFKEKGLQNEGTFKAAEKRYLTAAEVDTQDLRRWLKKAKTIQWDYKNIVKRRGKLVRISSAKVATMVKR
ncbi:MAG: DUF1801 domain-containing protein [Candidatus Kerfeldbacteria bacterium]|nr:DUF1801 domain-containing protein [Candidatus Kerfeldbacteria bacterium]